MELHSFSESSFCVKKWINEVLSNPDDAGSSNVIQQSIVLTNEIEMRVQDMNIGMEQSINNMVVNLPRVLIEVDTLLQESKFLQNQMKHLKISVEKVECSTAASMQTLVQLDTMKSRFKESLKDLRHVDNWTNISSDIEEVMEEGDIEKISGKLISLHDCLLILGPAATDYEKRSCFLDTLKIRLESLLSPRLIAAFSTRDLTNSIKYSRILNSLGLSKNLENFYKKYKTQEMVLLWRSSVEGCDLLGPPHWFSSFLEQLVEVIRNQLSWFREVFEECDPYLLIADLACNVLTSLDPKASQVVSIAVARQEEPINFLASLAKASEAFLLEFTDIISRPNVTKENEVELSLLNTRVSRAVYEPLKEQMVRYQEYEESLLLSHLISAVDLSQLELLDRLKAMKDYTVEMKLQCELAIERCNEVTSGFALSSVLSAVCSYFCRFSEYFSQIADHFDSSNVSLCGEQDWTFFTACVSLIQMSGNLLLAIEGTDEMLQQTLQRVAESLLAPESENNHLLIRAEWIFSGSDIENLITLQSRILDENEFLLGKCVQKASLLCQRSVQIALRSITEPISSHLAKIQRLSVGNDDGEDQFDRSSELLSASLSPQEYITQIGQYLMTLPQHLEPLLLERCPSLSKALLVENSKGLGLCDVLVSADLSAADSLISRVVQFTIRAFSEALMKLPKIPPCMIAQLVTDIDYICSIFDELGVPFCTPLNQWSLLLKTPNEKFWAVVAAQNCEPSVVADVKRLRAIPSNNEPSELSNLSFSNIKSLI